tara:strand:+ start:1099 stop:1506 length:408 start_codon:yes stop_codon:yes gene_type:complete
MKIDTNTLLFIGGGLLAYYLYENKGSSTYYIPSDRPKKLILIGGNCGSTYGPQGLEFEGKCQKCPEIVIQNGIMAPTPFQNECMKTGRSTGNLSYGRTNQVAKMPGQMTPSQFQTMLDSDMFKYGFEQKDNKLRN